jgi:hypothetical protein
MASWAPTPLAPMPSGLLVDVADGVDARRAVLAAEVHDLGGERELTSVAERAARVRVCGLERERVRRIHRRDRRRDLPGMRKIDQTGLLQRLHKGRDTARLVVGECGRERHEQQREHCGGFKHGFLPF